MVTPKSVLRWAKVKYAFPVVYGAQQKTPECKEHFLHISLFDTRFPHFFHYGGDAPALNEKNETACQAKCPPDCGMSAWLWHDSLTVMLPVIPPSCHMQNPFDMISCWLR